MAETSYDGRLPAGVMKNSILEVIGQWPWGIIGGDLIDAVGSRIQSYFPGFVNEDRGDGYNKPLKWRNRISSGLRNVQLAGLIHIKPDERWHLTSRGKEVLAGRSEVPKMTLVYTPYSPPSVEYTAVTVYDILQRAAKKAGFKEGEVTVWVRFLQSQVEDLLKQVSELQKSRDVVRGLLQDLLNTMS